MKIRTQFKLFIACIIAAPLIFAAALSVRQYYRSPERLLQSGYKQVRKMSEAPLSKKDFKTLKETLKSFPPEVELIIIANHSEILLSTIAEFKGQLTIDDPTLFHFIKQTSNRYFYQIVSPPLEDNSADVILITRMLRDKNQRHKPPQRAFQTFSVFLIAFELFCIVFVIYLSATVSRSITVLEKSTERIASGELDEPLQKPRDLRTSNEITNLADNLEKMRVTLKNESERRTRFIMGISHDLRTPVAVIKGYTEAMSEGFCDTPEETKKSLEIISTKTEQLETMINTLINFVKLNQTDWMQQLKKQNIVPVFKEFAEGAVTTGGIFKRNVTAHIDVGETIEIPFDKELVQRTLENLFSNALRYTAENDSIEISVSKIGSDEGEAILFKIKDSGIGIKKDDIEKIFDMFYRASSSRREEGMGIGLATVMTIVKAHGWRISVDSELGSGSCFTIEIPVHAEP